MNWIGGKLYPRVKCPRGQDTVPTESCPRGQDKPGGDILPWGKVSPGTRYHVVSCHQGQDTRGQDKPVHLYLMYEHHTLGLRVSMTQVQ